MREFTQRCTDVLEMYVRRIRSSGSGCTGAGASALTLADDSADGAWTERSTGRSSSGEPRCLTRADPGPRAELAGRRRDGAAGDRRRAAPVRPTRGWSWRPARRGAAVRAGRRPSIEVVDARVERTRLGPLGGDGRATWHGCATSGADAGDAAAQLLRVGVARAAARASPSGGATRRHCARRC